MSTGLIIGLSGAITFILVAFLLVIGYLKAPPDTALIISGFRGKRFLIGRAGWRIPFFERVDKISLRVIPIDVKTSQPVPTTEFINVRVDGVANVKVSSNEELLSKAAESLLGLRDNELANMVNQVLEGNMREIVGSMGLRDMVQDRKAVAERVFENAVPDMQKLGLEIVNFNIQNFKDEAGTIENLGIDNVERIRKDASIAKANAKRDVAIAEAEAKEMANAVHVEREKKISEQNAQLLIQQAELKQQSDTKQAEADAAYEIQKQIRQKAINTAQIEAETEKAIQQQKLEEQNVAIMEQQLNASVRRQAEAARYKSEQDADAARYVRNQEQEAELYAAQRAAEAMKIQAEAAKEAALLEAAGIQAKLEAEAAGKKAIALAEAEGIEAKAEAQAKMQDASVIEMLVNALPQIAKNVAAPLANVDNIIMYGDGNTTKLVQETTRNMSQVIEAASAVGLDLPTILGGFLKKFNPDE